MDDRIFRAEPHGALDRGTSLDQIAAHGEDIAESRPGSAVIRPGVDRSSSDRDSFIQLARTSKVCASLSIASRWFGFVREGLAKQLDRRRVVAPIAQDLAFVATDVGKVRLEA